MGWRPGRAAPWTDAIAAGDVDLRLAGIEAALEARGRGRLRRAPWRVELETRASAVLVPLYEQDDDVLVVLTRRSPQLRSHTWEVSFPGGRSDQGETAWQTAVREAHEEVGLDPTAARRIGELDAFVTVGSRSLVHPEVAALSSKPHLVANPDEVEQILHVSLHELLLPEVFREELWPIAEHERPITFFELHGNTVWGATAAMLRQLLSIAVGVDDNLTY